MSKAAAGGNGGAVAEATASVYCEGTNSQAEAWSESVAEAVRIDRSTGCVFLDTAIARASAKCVNGVARASAESKATSQLLGGCGLSPGGGGGGPMPMGGPGPMPPMGGGGGSSQATSQSSSSGGGNSQSSSQSSSNGGGSSSFASASSSSG
jgi:hypothetical protein